MPVHALAVLTRRWLPNVAPAGAGLAGLCVCGGALTPLRPCRWLATQAGAFIINVGRGSVVDEEAIADALGAGRLGGYAADVFAFEDWALQDRPAAVAERLLAHPHTLFTPHLGSAVHEVRNAIEHRAADNIIAVLAGQAPPDAINRPVQRVAA
ncbi:MAG: hypothetical protein IPO43_20910 [Rhodoferax sp.]|nr:hypothetical protein [Rhodoferax sp.]